MTRAPEPTDKLDATAQAAANGPEDVILDRGAVDWRACKESVRRFRQRTFRACLSRVLGNGHALVLRGARHSNVSGLLVQSDSDPLCSPRSQCHVSISLATAQRRIARSHLGS